LAEIATAQQPYAALRFPRKVSVTAKRPVGVSAPGIPTVTTNERVTRSAVRSSARRWERSTTIERFVHPESSLLASSRTQPSWPLGRYGVLTPAQSPERRTTPNTVGEPNSVFRPTRSATVPPPGSVRTSTSLPARTQTTG
jgi:hypothetical protein